MQENEYQGILKQEDKNCSLWESLKRADKVVEPVLKERNFAERFRGHHGLSGKGKREGITHPFFLLNIFILSLFFHLFAKNSLYRGNGFAFHGFNRNILNFLVGFFKLLG